MDSSAAEHRDWWTVFNDPVLSDLIQLAYQQNLTLQNRRSTSTGSTRAPWNRYR